MFLVRWATPGPTSIMGEGQMTIEELIAALQEMIEDGVEPETEVRLAMQPSYPFEYSVRQRDVIFVEDATVLDRSPGVVYLAEGKQVGYLPGEVRDELGW